MFVRRALDTGAYPQHERIAARALELGPNAVIVDAGANCGFAAVWFARAYPDATIFAVEPDAANFSMLLVNTLGYPNITPVRAGLWDQSARLRVVNPGSQWAVSVSDAGDSRDPSSEWIDTVTVDELVQRAGPLAEPLIVKLTIEGSERAVFRSNTSWLDRTGLVVYMPGDWAQPGKGIAQVAMAALSSRSFDWIIQELCVLCFRYASPDRSAPHAGDPDDPPSSG
jgi:FkbM family methyltransferase